MKGNAEGVFPLQANPACPAMEPRVQAPLVSRFRPRHPRADGVDDTAAVRSPRVREPDRYPRDPVPDEDVEVVERARADADTDLPRARNGVGEVAVPDLVESSVLAEIGGFQGIDSPRGRSVQGRPRVMARSCCGA